MLKPARLAALAFAALITLVPTCVEATTISVPFVTVGVGDTFLVPVSIADATDLTSWQFDLAFDPAIVMANSVTEGPFMSAFGATLFGPGVIDNLIGSITLVTDSYIGFAPFPSGAGVLADIEFTALAPGVSPLTFSNVFLNLSDLGFGVANGQITVEAVPEPATLALLTSGLAVLARRRWARRGQRDEC